MILVAPHERLFLPLSVIVFLLLRLVQQAIKDGHSPLAFARLVRANLMHRRRIDRLLEPEAAPPLNPNQMLLQWS